MRFLFISVIGLSSVPLFAFAQEFTALAPIPGVTDVNDRTLVGYLNALYFLLISVAAIFAVVKLSLAGLKYMGNESFGSKEGAKEDIRASIIGLVIILATYIILNTINPQLTNFEIFRSNPPVAPASNTGNNEETTGPAEQLVETTEYASREESPPGSWCFQGSETDEDASGGPQQHYCTATVGECNEAKGNFYSSSACEIYAPTSPTSAASVVDLFGNIGTRTIAVVYRDTETNNTSVGTVYDQCTLNIETERTGPTPGCNNDQPCYRATTSGCARQGGGARDLDRIDNWKVENGSISLRDGGTVIAVIASYYDDAGVFGGVRPIGSGFDSSTYVVIE